MKKQVFTMPTILYHLFLNLSTLATTTHNVTISTAIVAQNPVAKPSQNVILSPQLLKVTQMFNAEAKTQ
jgi:hypothetical protein